MTIAAKIPSEPLASAEYGGIVYEKDHPYIMPPSYCQNLSEKF